MNADNAKNIDNAQNAQNAEIKVAAPRPASRRLRTGLRVGTFFKTTVPY